MGKDTSVHLCYIDSSLSDNDLLIPRLNSGKGNEEEKPVSISFTCEPYFKTFAIFLVCIMKVDFKMP